MAAHQPLHKHAFWLFGVLVGLAIKDALEATVPHLVEFSHIKDLLTPLQLLQPQSGDGLYPDLARLVLFLILIVRFYLGSVFYFGDVYGDEDHPQEVKVKIGAIDHSAVFAGALRDPPKKDATKPETILPLD